ncbi:hypothetical protein AAKU52_001410 [Pedobacter sp. CG_S7]|uniref:metallophosphoesterase n=1 Tax=Pedobacter sp. CG_S7 TaxID=3143930 RepID=UPI0033979C5A
MKQKIKYPVIISLVLASYTYTFAQKFTIPVFPDTQAEVSGKSDLFYSQIDWIVKHKDSLNIPIVLHVGDLVNFDNYDNWEVASKGFKQMDDNNIPYAIAVGNHDTEAVNFDNGSAAPGNVNQNLRKTSKFESYFPTNRFTLQRGRYEKDKSDNAFYTFKVGETNWLVLSLEFCPRLGAINWAGDIVKQYFNYNVIILTHYHLTTKGEIAQNNAGYGDFSPQDVFNKLIKKHQNIRYVFSGHVMTSSLKIDTGDHGNKIYQVLQNYQNIDAGGGYLKLFTFDIEKGSIDAKMYSPYYNITKIDSSNFVLKEGHVNFLGISC